MKIMSSVPCLVLFNTEALVCGCFCMLSYFCCPETEDWGVGSLLQYEIMRECILISAPAFPFLPLRSTYLAYPRSYSCTFMCQLLRLGSYLHIYPRWVVVQLPMLLEGFFVCCLCYFGSTYFNSRHSLHHYPFLLNKDPVLGAHRRNFTEKSSGCDAVTSQLGWAFFSAWTG